MPEMVPETDESLEVSPVFVPPPRPVRKRPPVQQDEAKKGKLPLLLGVGGGIAFVVVAFLVYFLVIAGPPQGPSGDPKPPQRATFHVLANSAGARNLAVRQAKEGDLILLEGDVIDSNVEVKVANLTIEPEPGRKVTWTSHPRAAPGAKLLLVSNVPGLQLRGIALDGKDKAEALISFYGRCQATHLDKVQLKGAIKYGVIFVNCEGTAEAPVRFTEVLIATAKPTESAIRFDISTTLPSAPKVNAYFDFRQVTFSGPGRKLTTPNTNFVLTTTLGLRAGDTLETVP